MKIVEDSKIAQRNWKQTSLEERKRLVSLFVDYVVSDKEDIATELSWLIGRPKQQNFNEVKGFETRARYLISIADSSLQAKAKVIKSLAMTVPTLMTYLFSWLELHFEFKHRRTLSLLPLVLFIDKSTLPSC